MKRKCHNPERIIRKLRTAEQLLRRGSAGSIPDFPAACMPVDRSTPQYPAAPCTTSRHRVAEASQSYPCAGAGGLSTDGCGLMAGASITSGCNGSGVRKGSKDTCLARASALGLPVAAWSCCALNTLTTSGRSNSSSTRRWTSAPASS